MLVQRIWYRVSFNLLSTCSKIQYKQEAIVLWITCMVYN